MLSINESLSLAVSKLSYDVWSNISTQSKFRLGSFFFLRL